MERNIKGFFPLPATEVVTDQNLSTSALLEKKPRGAEDSREDDSTIHSSMVPPNFKYYHCFQAMKRFLICYSLLDNFDHIQDKYWF